MKDSTKGSGFSSPDSEFAERSQILAIKRGRRAQRQPFRARYPH